MNRQLGLSGTVRLAILLGCLLVRLTGFAQEVTDRSQIETTIANYVDAFYQGDTAKAMESVSPELAKRGFFRKGGVYMEATMSYAQLLHLATEWHKGRDLLDAKKIITIFDINSNTATAKVETVWGVDYLHLLKKDQSWKIIHVLWQSLPKS